ncbi:MAG: glutamate synthase-related protein [Planctomycetes bacterium]|jgi:ferredoxin|nr:glutamate synthase-related protein [Planctomycetota bacterium]
MPEKYHIETKPVLPRRPRVGKFGVVDWREDCARCHNCVKKACVYDRYRQEAEYLRTLEAVDALFFECMGCFSCVQNCTKGLLRLVVNPVYEALGNSYWTPDIIHTTWTQAETAKIPVSGAGYRGPFSGPGFDGMWTDMSEIVRPTRDGIHGREYISTAVDIGRKPAYLTFDRSMGILPMSLTGVSRVEGQEGPATHRQDADATSCLSIQMPLILDLPSPHHTLPKLGPALREAAVRTDIIALASPSAWPFDGEDTERVLPHTAFCLNPEQPVVPPESLAKTRLLETYDGPDVIDRLQRLKDKYPEMVVSVRVPLDAHGVQRAIDLAVRAEVEVLHVVADPNGNQIGVQKPLFLKDMIRRIHTTLIEKGVRDEITLIAGGGIALPEHMAKAIICGADVVSIDLPLMIALECHLCDQCAPGMPCPARLDDVPRDYAVGRMVNLIAAWHDQLIEVMGAMGMREARRLRGDVGRAMFFEDLEEDTFGKLFGKRK